MMDKGKYASHGAFIKRLNKSAMVHWEKPKLGKNSNTQPSSTLSPLPSRERRKLTTRCRACSSNQKHFPPSKYSEMQVSISVECRQEASLSGVLPALPLYRKSYKKTDSVEKAEPGQKVRPLCHHRQSQKDKKCKKCPKSTLRIQKFV